jgi:hypothetical protein
MAFFREPLVSMKWQEFPNQLSNHLLLKDSVPWSVLPVMGVCHGMVRNTKTAHWMHVYQLACFKSETQIYLYTATKINKLPHNTKCASIKERVSVIMCIM